MTPNLRGGSLGRARKHRVSVSQDKRQRDAPDEARRSESGQNPQNASQLRHNHLMTTNGIMQYYGNDWRRVAVLWCASMKSLRLAGRGPLHWRTRDENWPAFEDALAPGVGVGGSLVGAHITLKINLVSLARCLLRCYFVTVLWIIGLKPRLKQELLNHTALKRRLGRRALCFGKQFSFVMSCNLWQAQSKTESDRRDQIGQLREQLKNAS